MILTAPRIVRGEPLAMEPAVRHLLPPNKTNSIEVQYDLPNREHTAHQHPTDETLLVLEGEITFRWDNQAETCRPGDRLLLPVGIVHSSVAGEHGCLYLIAQSIIPGEPTS
jgi:quercetin dioxygenase-like cupin family protein